MSKTSLFEQYEKTFRLSLSFLFVEDADALYAEYAAQGVELTRELANTPWHERGSW